MALPLTTVSRERVVPGRWFALAVPATIGYVAIGAVLEAVSGRLWVGVLAAAALAVATTGAARHRSHEGMGAYVAGTAVTLLGLYATLAVAAELWLHGVSG